MSRIDAIRCFVCASVVVCIQPVFCSAGTVGRDQELMEKKLSLSYITSEINSLEKSKKRLMETDELNAETSVKLLRESSRLLCVLNASFKVKKEVEKEVVKLMQELDGLEETLAVYKDSYNKYEMDDRTLVNKLTEKEKMLESIAEVGMATKETLIQYSGDLKITEKAVLDQKKRAAVLALTRSKLCKKLKALISMRTQLEQKLMEVEQAKKRKCELCRIIEELARNNVIVNKDMMKALKLEEYYEKKLNDLQKGIKIVLRALSKIQAANRVDDLNALHDELQMKINNTMRARTLNRQRIHKLDSQCRENLSRIDGIKKICGEDSEAEVLAINTMTCSINELLSKINVEVLETERVLGQNLLDFRSVMTQLEMNFGKMEEMKDRVRLINIPTDQFEQVKIEINVLQTERDRIMKCSNNVREQIDSISINIDQCTNVLHFEQETFEESKDGSTSAVNAFASASSKVFSFAETCKETRKQIEKVESQISKMKSAMLRVKSEIHELKNRGTGKLI